MEKTEIIIASVLLIGLLIGIGLGWYLTMWVAKQKFVEGKEIKWEPRKNSERKKKPAKKEPAKIKPSSPAKSPVNTMEDTDDHVDIKKTINNRNIESFTDFVCDTDGTDVAKTIHENRTLEGSAYEYLKTEKDL